MEQQISSRKYPLLIGAALLAVMLGGCNKANELASEASDYVFARDANLKERNYAAADYLVSRTQKVIDKNTVLVPEPLMHANNTGMTSAFGKDVTYQVAERFAELGYNVKLSQNNPAQPRYMDPIPQTRGVAIGGTYEQDWNSALIKLRLIDRSTGEILGFFDYSLPVTRLTADSVKDKPTAYRVTE